jgi:hypothetical protein
MLAATSKRRDGAKRADLIVATLKSRRGGGYPPDVVVRPLTCVAKSRTVENARGDYREGASSVMRKMRARSFAELVTVFVSLGKGMAYARWMRRPRRLESGVVMRYATSQSHDEAHSLTVD